MIRRKIDPVAGRAALELESAGEAEIALAVRFCLEELATRSPGGLIELRVPPYGATQLVAGAQHRRGTPPNVVETDPASFLSLCRGEAEFQDLVSSGKIIASGVAGLELAKLFPLFN